MHGGEKLNFDWVTNVLVEVWELQMGLLANLRTVHAKALNESLLGFEKVKTSVEMVVSHTSKMI